MNREIKFRGFNEKNKKWIYGYYLVNRGEHFICEDGIQSPDMTWEDFLVSPDSIGQFTGLHDKNGREIYEGDLVRTGIDSSPVVWNDKIGLWCMYLTSKPEPDGTPLGVMTLCYDTYVIGNIHDNSELIKEEQQ